MSSIPKIYRSLLPHLSTPSPVRNRTPLHNFIRTTLSTPPPKANSPAAAAAASNGSSKTQTLLAAEFGTYLKAQSEYVRLLERYNPALTGVTEGEAGVKRTARRVGLEVPNAKK